jgi:hypothetical protein
LEGDDVRIDRGQVIQLLKDRGEVVLAERAEEHLPSSLDLDDPSHVELLERYDIDVPDLRPGPGQEGGLGGPPSDPARF